MLQTGAVAFLELCYNRIPPDCYAREDPGHSRASKYVGCVEMCTWVLLMGNTEAQSGEARQILRRTFVNLWHFLPMRMADVCSFPTCVQGGLIVVYRHFLILQCNYCSLENLTGYNQTSWHAFPLGFTWYRSHVPASGPVGGGGEYPLQVDCRRVCINFHFEHFLASSCSHFVKCTCSSGLGTFKFWIMHLPVTPLFSGCISVQTGRKFRFDWRALSLWVQWLKFRACSFIESCCHGVVVTLETFNISQNHHQL